MSLSHYEILGVNYDATLEELNSALIILKQEVTTYNYFNSVEKLKKIRKACQILMNPKTRERYDRTLSSEVKRRITINYKLYHDAILMFQNLKEKTRKNVDVYFIKNNNLFLIRDRLMEVIPFQYLKVRGINIPFIGRSIAIIAVIEKENQEIIYRNDNIFGVVEEVLATEKVKENYDLDLKNKIKLKINSWGSTFLKH